MKYTNNFLPNDLSIHQDNDNKWIWGYRCLNSDDNYYLTFETSVDALCHFISIILEAQDAELLDDDDDFDD